MINIVNRKTYRGEGVYIGRPSLLGNPFRIGRDGTREEVIFRYRAWLWRRIQEQGDVYWELHRLAEIARNGDLNLICWCKLRYSPLSRQKIGFFKVVRCCSVVVIVNH
jgi:hypothetical protein